MLQVGTAPCHRITHCHFKALKSIFKWCSNICAPHQQGNCVLMGSRVTCYMLHMFYYPISHREARLSRHLKQKTPPAFCLTCFLVLFTTKQKLDAPFPYSMLWDSYFSGGVKIDFVPFSLWIKFFLEGSYVDTGVFEIHNLLQKKKKTRVRPKSLKLETPQAAEKQTV